MARSWYNVPVNEDQLTAHIRVRVTPSTKKGLELIAQQRGPGSKVGDLVREAIYKTYFQSYPIPEVTALRAAEEPKKSRSQ